MSKRRSPKNERTGAVVTRRELLIGTLGMLGCSASAPTDKQAAAGASVSPTSSAASSTSATTTTVLSQNDNKIPLWSARKYSRDNDRIREIRRQFEKLIPLHKKPAKPQPGDWLYEHKERGQLFTEYHSISPVLPDDKRHKIMILPLGPLSENESKIVTLTAEYLSCHFSLETIILPPIQPSIPKRATRKKEDKTEQWLTGHLLDEILRPKLPEDATVLLGFTSVDLWPGKGWNYVFGQADLNNRVGVWSMNRFGKADGSNSQYKKTLFRTLQIAAHETGHMFSLEHCTAYQCVQAGVNSLEEADKSPLWLCPECEAKIAWATKMDIKPRMMQLAAFCQKEGFSSQAAFFDQSAAALG